MSIPNDQWNEALKAVFAKATTDAAFREKCLSEPLAAIKEASALEVSATEGIKFSETCDGSAIVLPAFGAAPDEILEAELDSVAGGGDPQGGYSNYTQSGAACGHGPTGGGPHGG